MRRCALSFTTLGLVLSIVALGIAPPARGAAAAKDSGAGATRNRAAALLDNGEDAKAIVAFRDLAKRFPESAPDRVNLAIALINHNDLDDAESELRAALAKAPDDLRAHYNLGLVLKKRGKNEDAAKEMGLVAGSSEGAKDATVWYQLGLLNKRLRKSDEALAAFRKAVALQPEHGSAHFQLYNELVQRGDKAAAQPELDEFKLLQKTTPEFQRNEAYLERGTFTKIDAPGAGGTSGAANAGVASTPPAAIRFELRGAPVKPGATALKDKGPVRLVSSALADFDGDGALDIAVATDEGRVRIYRNSPAGTFSKTLALLEAPGFSEAAPEKAAGTKKSAEKGAELGSDSGEVPREVPDAVILASADIDNDGDVDLLVTSGAGIRLFLNNSKGRFTDETKAAGLEGVLGAAGAALTDVDRDGDLDLVLGELSVRRKIGSSEYGDANPPRARPRLFLNAGLYPDSGASGASGAAISAKTESATATPAKMTFLPAGSGAGLPEVGETVVAADTRGRGDPDLLFGFARGQFGVAHNLRGGRFSFDMKEGIGGEGRVEASYVTNRNGLPPPPAHALLGDLDGDGYADLVGNGLLWNNGAGLFPGALQDVLSNSGRGGDPVKKALGWALLDVDGDGLLDIAGLVVVSGSVAAPPPGTVRLSEGPHLLVFHNDGSRQFTRVAVAEGSIDDFEGPVSLLSGDLDGDGDPDLVIVTPEGPPIVLANVTKTANRWIKVALKGGKTNRSGLGARVEVRADRLFASRESDGNPTLVGIGPRGRADAVRVVWTSGVTQDLIDVPAGSVKIEEKREFSGSCPFLYAWDGTTFRFVGEALSGAPVGFLRPDGAYEAPRPTEHLRLPPGMPAARGGRLSLRMTEEMRELSALDGVRLVAVDHPASVEVYSNERLTGEIETFAYVAVADLRPAEEAREGVLGSAGAPGERSDDRSDVPDAADAAAALAALDDRAASGFATLGPRLEGLAEPHVLELRFAHPPPPPSRLALVLDGWVAWTTSDVSRALLQATQVRDRDHEAGGTLPPGAESSANPSVSSSASRGGSQGAARFAGIALPNSPSPWGPALEARAPGASGVASDPDIGLPIGPSMLMPLPAGNATGEAILEIRIGTSLAVYYDRIRLGRIVDATLTVRELAPMEATLRWRGVGAQRRARDDEATRPDYDAVSPLSPFPRLDEETTPLGDVLNTVSQADDRLVVFGTGEEIAVEFDAGAIPPPAAGLARTWFLVSRGYARDGDPNTKPLPWGTSPR